jgi:hypothetical protein
MYRAKKGRKVTRLALEEVKERFEAQYEEASSQEIYARRKAGWSIPLDTSKGTSRRMVF